jgi:hypothetical protein
LYKRKSFCAANAGKRKRARLQGETSRYVYTRKALTGV